MDIRRFTEQDANAPRLRLLLHVGRPAVYSRFLETCAPNRLVFNQAGLRVYLLRLYVYRLERCGRSFGLARF